MAAVVWSLYLFALLFTPLRDRAGCCGGGQTTAGTAEEMYRTPCSGERAFVMALAACLP